MKKLLVLIFMTSVLIFGTIHLTAETNTTRGNSNTSYEQGPQPAPSDCLLQCIQIFETKQDINRCMYHCCGRCVNQDTDTEEFSGEGRNKPKIVIEDLDKK